MIARRRHLPAVIPLAGGEGEGSPRLDDSEASVGPQGGPVPSESLPQREGGS